MKSRVQELVQIGAGPRDYEFDTNATPLDGGGDVTVDVNGGATPAQSVTALVAAVNADAGYTAVDLINMGVVAAIVAAADGVAGNLALAETMGAEGVVSAALMTGGEEQDDILLERISYTVTAQDVTTWTDVGCLGIPIAAVDLGVAVANLGPYGFTVTRAGVFVSPNTLELTFVTVSGTKAVLRLDDPAAVLAAGDVIRVLISAQ